jgi:cephalosporin-C deacetylase-like acetyl esterase
MRKLFIIVGIITLCGSTIAQPFEGKYSEANYKESEVPSYTLPNVLTTFDGKKINTTKQWEKLHKPEIIDFFEQNIYGEVPVPIHTINKTFEIISKDESILEGLCTRKNVNITFKNKIGKVTMPLILFVPNNIKKPAPVIFLANGSDIKNNRLELDNSQRFGYTLNGIPLRHLMERGIGLATIDYQAFATDKGDKEGKVSGGITNLFFKEDQKYTKENEWGMMAIWAYAMRAGMDYLETDSDVNPEQVAVLGCSIGGKVALWAAATDKRFGMILLATAGHGGDAIWRRKFGETLENMCKYLPTWTCRNAQKYADNVQDMPVDQHCLLATLAPRPLYVSNAQDDFWADPKGQWIGTYNAVPAYNLYNKKVAFKSHEQPSTNHPIIKSTIGYHVRSGFHGLEVYDWLRYMEFIEYHFMKRT